MDGLLASKTQLDALLAAFQSQQLQISHFVVSVLQHSSFTKHPAVLDLLTHSSDILNALLNHPESAQSTINWANDIIKANYSAAIKELAAKENGWHFIAAKATAEQLESFRIEDIARDIRLLAPELWDLIGLMLTADQRTATEDPVADDPMVSDDDLPQDPKTRAERNAERRDALLLIKRVVIITNTPSKVIETLAHMGISISEQSIEQAIHSLSRESYAKLREMGQTLLTGYAYDNFDIDFKLVVPTVEKEKDTLTHLTSGDFIFLEHGVKPEHLKCSEELWSKSPLNPEIDPSKIPPPRTVLDLERLHPEADHPSGLTRRERFNAWKFREDIVLIGPHYFRQFKARLGLPEPVEQIPVVKMRHAPARSMDIKQSTVEGNLKVIPELLKQGGVGDPLHDDGGVWEKNIISMVPYVILFHGDLGTGERIMSLLQRRAIESTPWLRYQYVIYVMGLFHLKMACADAIWRIFIKPVLARKDSNSVMHFVALHREKETGKIGSDPGFRRMHEVITHEGAALRLDAWRVEILRHNSSWSSLEAFAESKPSFELLEEISNHLASHYVAGAEDLNIYEVRQNPAAQRDQQHENILQIHQYFLLYEEMSWSMNYGDIGRIETCFPVWIYIFKATGKHKHAIRYNILTNPDGTVGKCRGVDWVVEQMINLPTKDTYGGRGSNYTKKRVIEESTLIQVYRQCCRNIERNFHLTSLTSHHAPPNMEKTHQKMAKYLQENGPNEHRPGRKTEYIIPDIINQGQAKMNSTEKTPEEENEEAEDQDAEERPIEPEDMFDT
ncbi:hypothetical protein B0H15DRAFT_805015 [Mycena belliarum]|uniref:DUF6589 domain-containing protein n=1 Tax=Mycena belliarum TaxID=1033014 RepID=A0AAD6TXT1_9AGAR|nr:hypothetical protein B0H15DRAFT_805015 [Mycena belliae]